MSVVFISYRRIDSGGIAGRIYDRLVREFGESRVFMDVEGRIPEGADFPSEIERALASATALLVIIGRQWVTCTDDKGHPRIQNDDDWVASEIGFALERKILVVPVLVDGAAMPLDTQLPKRIAGITRKQASDVRASSWNYDVRRIVATLKPVLRPHTSRWKAAAAIAVVTAALAIAGVVTWAPLKKTGGEPQAVPPPTGTSPVAANGTPPPPMSPEEATARHFDAIKTNPATLLAFLTEMPKGGDLHNHLSGAIYAESYLRWAAEDNLCFTTSRMAIVAGPCDANVGQPPVAQVLQNGVLYGQAIDAMSMRNWNPALPGHDHFFSTFAKFGPASSRTGDMLAEVAARAATEHVSYLELMLTPDGGVSARLGRESAWDANLGQLRDKLLAGGFKETVLGEARKRLDAAELRARELLRCGTPKADPGCLVTIRYIAQVGRAASPESVFAQILAGFELASADPRIVSFNLVQPEDDAIAIRDFALQMSMIDSLRAHYPRVPITLHAGELVDGLVPGEALRFHISESVRTGHALRIGHGVDVMHENGVNALLKDMASRHVLVEIALSSNDLILGVKGANHPLRTYLDHKVPVALVTDDPGVSRSTMTLEYRKAVEEHGLDYRTLKQIARNSLEYAFADVATKARLRANLEGAFGTFEKEEARTSVSTAAATREPQH